MSIKKLTRLTQEEEKKKKEEGFIGDEKSVKLYLLHNKYARIEFSML